MEAPTLAEMAAQEAAEIAAREEAWRAAQAQWQVEIQKPPRHREYFQVEEIAKALARQRGRLAVDDLECQRIVLDLFEWVTRGECDETDVLMLVGQPQLFKLFLPGFRAAREDAERKERKIWRETRSFGANRLAIELPHGLAGVLYDGWLDINMGAVVLRRAAVRLYLESCGLDGASRVLGEWFTTPTVGRRRKRTDFKAWFDTRYTEGAIPAGTTVKEIGRAFEAETKIKISETSIRRALVLKK